jgi:hypothetical protein
MFPDVICYWSAARLLASGQNPYDIDGQRRVQQEYGWDRDEHGFGIYDFLPYYYPPWFGLVWAAFLPLGFPAARLAWFLVNVEMALGAGYLLSLGMTRGWWLPIVLAPLFFFSLACLVLGQTALLVFFLAVLAWKLLEGGSDAWAGVVLAWLTIKPQLTAVLLLGVLLWALRRRRWKVVWSFAATLLVLAGASTAVCPSWLVAMLKAPGQTASPTEYYPWIGNAWLLVLRALGLRGGWLWALYLAAALPFLGAVVWTALNRDSRLADLVALGVLAAFFVAPYARHYDFPILLIPLVLLLRERLSTLVGVGLLGVLVLVPYFQLFVLADLKTAEHSSVKFFLESTYFWVPVVLTALWAASGHPLHRSSLQCQRPDRAR